MGVSGSGKTTIGHLLSQQLGWQFYDGDDFHPSDNVAKMSQGVALTDEERLPWLRRLRQLIVDILGRGECAVISCSALRASYRTLLAGGVQEVRFVYLRGPYPLIRKRLRDRRGHFMKESLLRSQFETLEEPADAYWVDASLAPRHIVTLIKDNVVL